MINNLLSLKVFAGEENSAKIVRVSYVNFENYQEGGDGEYKRGFGYEYLQRISYSTGWQYEYVYGSFSDLLQMLKDGEIDLMGDPSYTEERAKDISFSDLQISETFRENFGIQVETMSYSSIDEMITAAFSGKIDLFGPLYSDFWLINDWLFPLLSCDNFKADEDGDEKRGAISSGFP